MDIEDFSTEMRGYKKDEVDRVLGELRAELEHVREYNFNAASELDTLRAEVAALKKKKDSAPGYAELGAQFEQTLRLAEEQAKKMATDAAQDAIRVRETAKAESEQLSRKAQQKADAIAAEAEAKLAEAKIQAESLSSEILQSAKAKESEAAERLQPQHARHRRSSRRASVTPQSFAHRFTARPKKLVPSPPNLHSAPRRHESSLRQN